MFRTCLQLDVRPRRARWLLAHRARRPAGALWKPPADLVAQLILPAMKDLFQMGIVIDRMIDKPDAQPDRQVPPVPSNDESLQHAFQFYEGLCVLGAVVVYRGDRHALCTITSQQIGPRNEIAHHGIFVTKMLHGREIEGIQEVGQALQPIRSAGDAGYFIDELNQAFMFQVESKMANRVCLLPTEKRIAHRVPPVTRFHERWQLPDIP